MYIHCVSLEIDVDKEGGWSFQCINYGRRIYFEMLRLNFPRI
jgi:hypothetical protein